MWVTNNIDRDSMVLDNVNFYLEQSTPLIVSREMDAMERAGKRNVKMTPRCVFSFQSS